MFSWQMIGTVKYEEFLGGLEISAVYPCFGKEPSRFEIGQGCSVKRGCYQYQSLTESSRQASREVASNELTKRHLGFSRRF